MQHRTFGLAYSDWHPKSVLRAHKHYGAWKEGVGVSEQSEFDTEQFSEHMDVPALALDASCVLGE